MWVDYQLVDEIQIGRIVIKQPAHCINEPADDLYRITYCLLYLKYCRP
jgi:hypothetical protein